MQGTILFCRFVRESTIGKKNSMCREHLSLLLLERMKGFQTSWRKSSKKKTRERSIPRICRGIKPGDDCGWEASVQPNRDRKMCLESPQAKALPGAGVGSGRGSSSWDGVEQPQHWGERLGLQHKDDGKLARALVNFMRLRRLSWTRNRQ